MFDEKRPRVEQVNFVHHEHDDTEVAGFASTNNIAQKESMTQHVTSVVVAKKYWTFLTRAHLKINSSLFMCHAYM